MSTCQQLCSAVPAETSEPKAIDRTWAVAHLRKLLAHTPPGSRRRSADSDPRKGENL